MITGYLVQNCNDMTYDAKRKCAVFGKLLTHLSQNVLEIRKIIEYLGLTQHKFYNLKVGYKSEFFEIGGLARLAFEDKDELICFECRLLYIIVE